MIIIDEHLFVMIFTCILCILGIIIFTMLLIDDIVANKNSEECFMYIIKNKKYNSYFGNRLYGIIHFTNDINDAVKFKTKKDCKKALKYIIKKENFELIYYKEEKINKNNLEIKRVLKNEEIFKK